MKLSQLVNLNESDEAGLNSFLAAAQLTRDNITVNPDGTINISTNVSLFGDAQPNWPKINKVNGNFGWYIQSEATPEVFDHLPKEVSGKCSVPIGGLVIRSSQLPRALQPTTLSLLNYTKGCGIILDDDTLSTYANAAGGLLHVPIRGGFEFAPRHWEADIININVTDLAGIPPEITCGSFYMTTTAKPLKTIHKQIRSLTIKSLASIKFPKGAPLLRILLMIRRTGTIYLNISGTVTSNPLINKLRSFIPILNEPEDLDVFSLQEMMIDAGLGAFART